MARKYYVYDLVDPRTGKIFYVGKGSGSRIDQHEKNANNGHDGEKCSMIRVIQSDGQTVIKRIIKRFDIENYAYLFEAERIKEIGIDNLTNIANDDPIEIIKDRSYIRKNIANIVKVLHILANNRDLTFQFAGKSYELDRSVVIEIYADYLKLIVEHVGKNLAISELHRQNVFV